MIDKFLQLKKKKTILAVGLMSGTSVDSIDAVLVEIRGSGLNTRFKQIAFHSHKYPKGLPSFVLNNSLPGCGTVDTISTLNILLAHFFADAVNAVAKKAGVPMAAIDLIGSHGQTIHHLPQKRKLFGKNICSTLQIGDPATIAKLTGIITVGDFRTGDMALGGQGAPLVPYFDFLAFRSMKKNRAVLNLGGIANITLLKKNCTLDDVVAFDTGPANMVIDGLMKILFNKEYDKSGKIASTGKINTLLLASMIQHPYFVQPIPKSTGREIFGKHFIKRILQKSKKIPKEDVIATATEFTSLTVYQQFASLLQKRLRGEPLHQLIISGGGTKNSVATHSLQKYFYPTEVLTSDYCGVPSDSKEAMCFALFAHETIHNNPSNIPSVTGARRAAVLGKICV